MQGDKKGSFGFRQVTFFSIIIAAIFFAITGPGEKPKGLKEGHYGERVKMVSRYLNEDYFKDNTLHNIDFSEGLKHWCSSNGSDMFGESQSQRSINIDDFHSPPQCLQVIGKVVPSMIFYVRQEQCEVLDNPYAFDSDVWMGIRPGQKMILSYWYKGYPIAVRVHLLGFRLNGDIYISLLFRSVGNDFSGGWRQEEKSLVIPQRGVAVALEIEVTGENKLTLIDDINILVE